jgi:23S rRNA A1618 N6-methylase RlmF
VGNEKIFDHCLEEITSKFEVKDKFIVSVCNPPFYALDEERLKVRQITD